MGCSCSKQEVQRPVQPTILTHKSIGSDQHSKQESNNENDSADPDVAVYLGDYVWDQWDDVHLDDLCSSGCTEVVFQGTDIRLDDDDNFKALHRNGWELVAANADGSATYVGDQTHPFAVAVASLKNGTSHSRTSITRVSLSVCQLPQASGAFSAIKRIKQKEGGKFCQAGSQLWNAFEALFNAVELDSIVIDDEMHHDSSVLAEFSSMIAQFGKQVIPVPYFDQTYWKQVVDQTMNARRAIGMMHVQDYGGGWQNENHVSDWKFEVVYPMSPSPPFIIPVNPGFDITGVLGCCTSPDGSTTLMTTKMREWKKAANEANIPVTGGWIWEYKPAMYDGTLRDWVSAIKSGMQS